MFLDDPFNNFRRSCFVPDALGVDHHNRALLANAQTISLGAEDATRAIGGRFAESEFLEPPFEVIPGFEAGRFVAADWLGLVGADQDMPIDFVQAEFGDGGLESRFLGIDRGIGGGFCHCGGFITTGYGALTIAAIPSETRTASATMRHIGCPVIVSARSKGLDYDFSNRYSINL